MEVDREKIRVSSLECRCHEALSGLHMPVLLSLGFLVSATKLVISITVSTGLLLSHSPYCEEFPLVRELGTWLLLCCILLSLLLSEVSVSYEIPISPSQVLVLLTYKYSYLLVILIICGRRGELWVPLFDHIAYFLVSLPQRALPRGTLCI